MTKATPNHRARTFTIRKDGSTYRTPLMSKQEFNDALFMTEEDWNNQLKVEQFIKIK